jgi:hypothetical protein
MVVIIVFLSIVAGMFSNWLKHRNTGRSPADEELIARLEERVRVLETIVTDSGYELRQRFRDLERDA